ncbi:hypothetical protein FHW16_005893 [Phyllobacterium myrsinacearum]|uniref:Uncharacterized protein n=1 Tax=Phyllobacterium myrsinacearum TaxID=28101 RepID=A0A839EX85_9HYPH|nr:hypothetical protein [Phyllobacterium myrsinacearum]
MMPGKLPAPENGAIAKLIHWDEICVGKKHRRLIFGIVKAVFVGVFLFWNVH